MDGNNVLSKMNANQNSLKNLEDIVKRFENTINGLSPSPEISEGASNPKIEKNDSFASLWSSLAERLEALAKRIEYTIDKLNQMIQ